MRNFSYIQILVLAMTLQYFFSLGYYHQKPTLRRSIAYLKYCASNRQQRVHTHVYFSSLSSKSESALHSDITHPANKAIVNNDKEIEDENDDDDEDDESTSNTQQQPLLGKTSMKIKVRQHVNPLSKRYMTPLDLSSSWLKPAAKDDMNSYKYDIIKNVYFDNSTNINSTSKLSQSDTVQTSTSNPQDSNTDITDKTLNEILKGGFYSHPHQPFFVDIGSAKGTWAINMAKEYPQYNFLGLEIRRPCVQMAMDRKISMNLTNVHFLACNVNVDLKRLLTEMSDEKIPIKQVSIQFPDPHFKKKHYKRKAVNNELIATIIEFMKNQSLYSNSNQQQRASISPIPTTASYHNFYDTPVNNNGHHHQQTRIFLQSDLKEITYEMMMQFLVYRDNNNNDDDNNNNNNNNNSNNSISVSGVSIKNDNNSDNHSERKSTTKNDIVELLKTSQFVPADGYIITSSSGSYSGNDGSSTTKSINSSINYQEGSSGIEGSNTNNLVNDSNTKIVGNDYDMEILSHNLSPVSIKTEREIATENKGGKVYRILLDWKP